MNHVVGDLIALALEGHFDVIVHGCNCFCTMGAGIARVIQEEFPEAYAADLVTIKGDRNKLGTYSYATVKRDEHQITIINAYTQFHYSGDDILVDYQAVRKVFSQLKTDYPKSRIGYPKIGSGLAGGDWTRIARIIEEELEGENHTLVVLPT